MHVCSLYHRLIETDEAEITADMISKRVRAGESRAEAQSVKWTAEGAVKGRRLRVFCDVAGIR